jgi:MtN3 and saliva related transmembrane protein
MRGLQMVVSVADEIREWARVVLAGTSSDASEKEMDFIELFGFFAGVLTTAANVPQVITTYRKRSAEGLSFRMLFLLSSGLLAWLIYGILRRDLPITATNACGAALALSLLAMKLKFDRRPTKD